MLKKWLLLAIILLFPGVYVMAFTLTTSAWQTNGPIPSQYTCDGQNVSPPLAWKNPPAGTKSFVLIMNDPDTAQGTWTHWILFNIPANVQDFPENLQHLPLGTLVGKNSGGHISYYGPCPPDNEHRYFFRLYALDTYLDLKTGVEVKTLQKAMQKHVIGNAELQGRYQRPQGNGRAYRYITK
jgi:Raf kinase inhibitor-like YbhB/YbcL family protein